MHIIESIFKSITFFLCLFAHKRKRCKAPAGLYFYMVITYVQRPFHSDRAEGENIVLVRVQTVITDKEIQVDLFYQWNFCGDSLS